MYVHLVILFSGLILICILYYYMYLFILTLFQKAPIQFKLAAEPFVLYIARHILYII